MRVIALSVLGLFVLVPCVSGAAATAPGDATESAPQQPVWSARNVVTSFSLGTDVTDRLGLHAERVDRTVQRNGLAFRSPEPWALHFFAPGDHFSGFDGGTIRHQGGFDLATPEGAVQLRNFELRPVEVAGLPGLEILDANGTVVLTGDHLHHELDLEAKTLRVFNVDLRIAAALAARLGDERLTGRWIGTMELAGVVDPPSNRGAVADADAEGGDSFGNPPPCGDWSGTPDVQLTEMSFIDDLARANGQVVMTPSARLKNVGTANVPWCDKYDQTEPTNQQCDFPPPPQDQRDQHPFLVWSVFRVVDGAMHQLGVSDIKHAFLTINAACDAGACRDGNVLGLGCEDVYGTGTNASNGSLGPRAPVHAGSGLWDHCDHPVPNTVSHFDVNGDCVQDYFGSGENAFTHGLAVNEADLMTAGADYYFQGWYVIRRDVDIFNTMGYRKIDPQFNAGNGTWTFGFQSSLINESPLDVYVDPASPGPNEANTSFLIGKGHGQLAVQVTDLGNGRFRYEYALMNHDIDAGIDRVDVPIEDGAWMPLVGFRDIDDDAGNDWAPVIAGPMVTWAPPAPDAKQEWHHLYNYFFETDAPPQAGFMTVSIEQKGALDVSVATLVPGDSTPELFADGFESGDTSAWSETGP